MKSIDQGSRLRAGPVWAVQSCKAEKISRRLGVSVSKLLLNLILRGIIQAPHVDLIVSKREIRQCPIKSFSIIPSYHWKPILT